MKQSVLIKPEEGGSVALFSSPWTRSEGCKLKDSILKEVRRDLKHGSVHLFDSCFETPRLQAAYGEGSYRFSGDEVAAKPWTPSLLKVKEVVDQIAHEFYEEDLDGLEINYVLCNLYRNGKDYIGWHADSESDMARSLIISVSFGAERDFLLRRMSDKKSVKVPLPHGSIVVMTGETQLNWKHSVPKRLRVLAPRLNLTFRVMKTKK